MESAARTVQARQDEASIRRKANEQRLKMLNEGDTTARLQVEAVNKIYAYMNQNAKLENKAKLDKQLKEGKLSTTAALPLSSPLPSLGIIVDGGDAGMGHGKEKHEKATATSAPLSAVVPTMGNIGGDDEVREGREGQKATPATATQPNASTTPLLRSPPAPEIRLDVGSGSKALVGGASQRGKGATQGPSTWEPHGRKQWGGSAFQAPPPHPERPFGTRDQYQQAWGQPVEMSTPLTTTYYAPHPWQQSMQDQGLYHTQTQQIYMQQSPYAPGMHGTQYPPWSMGPPHGFYYQ